MIEVWVYASATWKNQSKTESVGMWRETTKELNPSRDVSQKKNLATHMVNTSRRPKYGSSRCEETRIQTAKRTTIFRQTHLEWADVVFLAHRLTFTWACAHRTTSFLDSASLPLRHWMACSASCPGKELVSQEVKCPTSYTYSHRTSLALMAEFLTKLLLVNNQQGFTIKKRHNNKKVYEFF